MAEARITVEHVPHEFNLDHRAGQVINGKPVLDLEGVVAQIDSGQAQKVTANTPSLTPSSMKGVI